MRLTIFLIFGLALNAFSQPEWKLSKNFSFKNWEEKISNEQKIILMEKAHFTDFAEMFKASGTDLKGEISNFHFGHFNKDNKLDFIYASSLGSESVFFPIYLFKENKYEILATTGPIDDLIYNSTFTIPIIKSTTSPCCDDYIYSINIVKPISNSSYGEPITYYYEEKTEFPKELTMEQDFEVIKDLYYLRNTPLIDDTYKGENEPVGNISHSYTTGDVGKAYATTTDATGRVWWFVEMKNPKLKEGEHFPEKGTYYLGWMSSAYVKKVGQGK